MKEELKQDEKDERTEGKNDNEEKPMSANPTMFPRKLKRGLIVSVLAIIFFLVIWYFENIEIRVNDKHLLGGKSKQFPEDLVDEYEQFKGQGRINRKLPFDSQQRGRMRNYDDAHRAVQDDRRDIMDQLLNKRPKTFDDRNRRMNQKRMQNQGGVQDQGRVQNQGGVQNQGRVEDQGRVQNLGGVQKHDHDGDRNLMGRRRFDTNGDNNDRDLRAMNLKAERDHLKMIKKIDDMNRNANIVDSRSDDVRNGVNRIRPMNVARESMDNVDRNRGGVTPIGINRDRGMNDMNRDRDEAIRKVANVNRDVGDVNRIMDSLNRKAKNDDNHDKDGHEKNIDDSFRVLNAAHERLINRQDKDRNVGPLQQPLNIRPQNVGARRVGAENMRMDKRIQVAPEEAADLKLDFDRRNEANRQHKGQRKDLFDENRFSAEIENMDCIKLTLNSPPPMTMCIFSRTFHNHAANEIRAKQETITMNLKSFENYLTSYGDKATFIDCGAGLGVFSVTALRTGAHVVTIESWLPNLKLIKRSMEINQHTDATLVQGVLTDEMGYVGIEYLNGQVHLKYIHKDFVKGELVEGGGVKKVAHKVDELLDLSSSVRSINFEYLDHFITNEYIILRIGEKNFLEEIFSSAHNFFSTRRVLAVFMDCRQLKRNTNLSHVVMKFFINNSFVPRADADIGSPSLGNTIEDMWPDEVVWMNSNMQNGDRQL